MQFTGRNISNSLFNEFRSSHHTEVMQNEERLRRLWRFFFVICLLFSTTEFSPFGLWVRKSGEVTFITVVMKPITNKLCAELPRLSNCASFAECAIVTAVCVLFCCFCVCVLMLSNANTLRYFACAHSMLDFTRCYQFPIFTVSVDYISY